MPQPSPDPKLIVAGDDWGASPRYNAGILEAARAGAIDSASAMVLRPCCDPGDLLETGIEIGLHLELPPDLAEDAVAAEPGRQAALFERLFGRPPAYLDGHHHCHAAEPLASAVEKLVLALEVPVRPVGEAHAQRLRRQGIASPDRLVGRVDPGQPVLPDEIAAALDGHGLPDGITEWVVHPGHRDPAHGSSYDEEREEDLALLLELAAEPALAPARVSHREALA
ncbi:MAG: ChbG/HpnK family deacetylase [Actinomycetota bacterium]